MSKIKKIIALLSAAAMTMGMATTAMAADSATITVTKAENAELKYAQVIKTDTSTRTGWAFVNEYVEEAYLDAFSMTDDQALLEKMAEDCEENTVQNGGDYAEALSNVADLTDTELSFAEMKNGMTVSDAGVYAINATEVGFTYSHMAAFVGFGTADNGEYPVLQDAVIEAKKSSTTITKTKNDNNSLSEIGKKITYTLEAYVPRFSANDENKTFSISDKLYGATYYLTGDDAVATVNVEGIEGSYKNAEDFVIENGTDEEKDAYETFTINLDDLVQNDDYVGKKVTVKYTVEVTGTTVFNNATSHVGDSEYSSETVKVYTAEIVMTKYAEDEDNNALDDNEKLANAGFIVYKENDGVKSYATFDAFNKLNGWIAEKEQATEVFTGEDGTLTVEGLDVGTYYFEEKTAPKGYSVNQVPEKVEVTVNGQADKVITANGKMIDTKLSSLPATGGIGTTIFTIGGCVIMVAAAGLFFANRRKENK